MQRSGMIEILLSLVAFMLLAKRTPRRRRMGRYLRGKVALDFDLGALATLDAIAATLEGVVEERTFASSIVATWALADATVVADDGPIIVGVAHGDYTAVEIEEFIENAGSWTEGNLVAQEIAKRKIRIVGVFEMIAAGAQASQTYVLNDGKPIKTKLGWILTTGQSLDIWAYNSGTDTWTTASHVQVYGHVNLFPK